MFILLIRGVIVYLVVIVGVRLMGKRQIGELQPAELVVTILMSDLATMPLQNAQISLFQPLMLIFLLTALELLMTHLGLKFRPFRTLTQGNSVLIVKDGELQQDALRQLRYSVDDVMEALRLKDVFDLSDVAFAYVETNGELSVLQTPQQGKAVLPYLVVCDGRIITRDLAACGHTKESLRRLLQKRGLSERDVFLMTCTADGTTNIIRKGAAQCGGSSSA
ncbi:MAG: DUF421 domain-containing protein [Clostridia bacterium]|nr:DUF421 domain-containing protein [Clostridia bacterium]